MRCHWSPLAAHRAPHLPLTGEEVGNIHSRTEIVQMLELYRSHHALEDNEVKMASGVLTFKEKIVSSIMTPVADLFAVSITDVLDEHTMTAIFKAGYSRVPVLSADRCDVVGILFAKDLLLIEARDATPVVAVLSFFRRPPVQCVFNDCRLGELLHTFHASRQHIAIVRGVVETDGHDPTYRVIGIATYEDVIEEILQARCVRGWRRTRPGDSVAARRRTCWTSTTKRVRRLRPRRSRCSLRRSRAARSVTLRCLRSRRT